MKYKTHNISISRKTFLSLAIMLFAFLASVITTYVSVNDAYALSSSDVYTLYDTDWNREEYLKIVKKLGFTNDAGNADETKMLNFSDTRNSRILQSSGEWTVRIGGIDFTAVYLSRDTDDNVILTLWQAEGQKLTQFNESYSMANAISPRSNNYSTSYIRTAVLNNSGAYFQNYGNSRDDRDAALAQVNYVQSSDHEYALFTTGEVSDFIVAPNKVNWQLNHLSYLDDNYINELDDTESGYANIASNVYTAWGNDNLWLPSINEIAYTWNPTNNQRRNAYDSWLRSANIPNESANTYNTAYAYAYRLYAQGTPAQDYVTSEYAVRPAFHLNLTNLSKKVALTTGYEQTDTPNGEFTALQQAWAAAIDNSGVTTYGSKENPNTFFSADTHIKVAEVYYDTSYNSIVFKLFSDWGAKITTPDAKTHAYAVFGGEIETKLGALYPSCSYYTSQGLGSTIVEGASRYYLGGALYVGPGVKITIDLNGHTLNRNLYDPSLLSTTVTGAHKNTSSNWAYNGNQLYYGMVIYNVAGDLTIDDTNKFVAYEDVDANGVKNVGRITGGRRKTSNGSADGVYVADWEAQGSGVQCYAREDKNERAKFLLKNGAICYCDAETRAGALKLRRTDATMEGGMMVHCSSTSMGGAVYVHASTFNLNSGFMCYNYGAGAGGAIYLPNGGGSTIECYGINMNYNYTDGEGGAILASFGQTSGSVDAYGVPHEVIVHSGNFIGNHAGTGGAIGTRSGELIATLTVYDGVFKDNVAEREGGFMYVAAATSSNGAAPIGVHGGLIENNSAANGGVFYIAQGSYMGNVTVSGGTFRGNNSTTDGGAIYMNGGTFTMTGGTFDDCRAENGTGGALYMKGGTMNLNGGSFINNVAASYPGFYCGGSINIKGNLVVKNNKTTAGVINNIYLASESSVVNVTGALTGDLGVSKAIPDGKTTVNIAQGSGYTMSTGDLLAFHCDAGEDYLFSVNTSNNSIYMSLKPQHVHSYEIYH